MTKIEILDYLRKHRNDFYNKYQVSKIALFGSFSRDENRNDYDVDIAIETKLSDYFLLYDLKEELETIFHKKVYLVRIRKKMNSVLKNRILKDGIFV